MSTYLELCNQVGQIMGLQGTMSDVTTPRGIQRNIVEAVSSSWVDIQTLREDWEFMLAENSAFNTVEDQIVYTPFQVFGSTAAAANLSLYKTKDGFFLDNRPLSFISWEDWPFWPNEDSTQPMFYTVNSMNNNLHLQKPNGVYNIIVRYKKVPQVLSLSTDVPFLPQQFHNAIAYKAVERMSAYTGNAGHYQQYSMEGNRILGQMMRTYIKARKVYPRNFVI